MDGGKFPSSGQQQRGREGCDRDFNETEGESQSGSGNAQLGKADRH